MKLNHHLLITIVTLGLFAAGPSISSAQILEYKFNDTGTNSVSTGSTTNSVSFLDSAGAAANLHGGASSGVSGQTSDLAFDNTASTGMGTLGTGGRASGGNITTINGLSSFTMQGWFKTSTAGNVSGARLLEKNQSSSAQFSLQYHRTGTNGGLSLTLGTPTLSATTAFSSNIATFGLLDTWVFFAVTYDGTLATNNINFYYGTTTNSVALLSGSPLTLNAGSLNAINTGSFTIGNLNGNNRPWDGYMDNVRIYGATSGSGGVLDLTQLEVIRNADAIPEPGTLALLAVGLSFAAGWARRRKARYFC